MQLLRDWALSRYAPDYVKLQERNKKLEYFEQFFPKFVDQQVVDFQQSSDLTTDGKVKDICVMFTDVRGFTKLSQEISLNAANSFLNNFYDIVVHHTQSFGGVMDKFIGDGTMSIFGGLDRSRNYVKRCVAAGQAILEDFKDMTMQKDEPTLFLGIGIAQGPAMIGTFGNGEFVNFTAIGHTVNLSARIQGCVKNNGIFVNKEVTEFLEPEQYKFKGKFELKNVKNKVGLYEVVE